jgi:hypothetical protein
MENLSEWIPGLFLGIALSAGSGFRVFIPALVSNLAGKFGVVEVAENFSWMTSDTLTWILGLACLLEIGAYYVPFIDNLLDTVALPVSFAAGALITTSFIRIDDPVLQWGLGIVAGGGVAGTIQAGTGLLRLASSKFTAGFGNGIFSTIENIISVFISFMAIWLPVFMGVLVLYLVYRVIRALTGRKQKQSSGI